MIIGKRYFEIGSKTYVMGILNVTPDSFSDGGSYFSTEKALQRAKQMISDGVDIIDVGGESTRPGYNEISSAEEISRISPVIYELSKLNIPISVDTYKPEVAEAAIREGASLINDISGFKHNTRTAQICAETGVACCLMHNRKKADYTSFLSDVVSDLKESIEIALTAGVPADKIIIDPGVGFAKTYEQNVAIISNLDTLTRMGYPVLLGASAKSVIGNTLGLPVEDRLEGTLTTTVIAITKGCDFVRVHAVKENKRACTMADKICRQTE